MKSIGKKQINKRHLATLPPNPFKTEILKAFLNTKEYLASRVFVTWLNSMTLKY
jgi:hypothetical protein